MLQRLHLLLVFICYLTIANAQREITRQDLFWIKYQASYSVSDSWKLNGGIEDRRYFENNRQHMWLFSIDGTRKLKNGWTLGVGMMRWSILMPSNPESEFEVMQWEWRPYQFLTHKLSLGNRWNLNSRYLLEVRIRENTGVDPVTGSPTIEDGYFTYLRPRIRKEITYDLNNDEFPWQLAVYDELMIHFGADELPEMFDQNRWGVGVKKRLSENWSVNVGYINWYQQLNGNNYVQRNIFNCYISHSF